MDRDDFLDYSTTKDKDGVYDNIDVLDENDPNQTNLDNEALYLGFINYVGEESDGLNRYELIFTNDKDSFYGEEFNERPGCIINGLKPSDEYVTEVHTIRTRLKFDLLQDSCCFAFSDGLDGIVAIAWENMDDYDEYPEDGRLYFMFGEDYDEVERKLAIKKILM